MKFGLVGFPLGQIYSTVDCAPRETVERVARAQRVSGEIPICPGTVEQTSMGLSPVSDS